MVCETVLSPASFFWHLNFLVLIFTELLDFEKRSGEVSTQQSESSLTPNGRLKSDIARAAEKELLVTAMISAEMALKRKATILETIKSLNAEGVFDGTRDLSNQARTSVKKHVTWLLDILQEANDSYRVSKEYIDCLTEFPTEKDALIPTNVDIVMADVPIEPPQARDSLADSHAVRLLLHSWHASNAAVSHIRKQGDVSPEMEGLLRSVGQLLLIPTSHLDDPSLSKAHVAEALQTAVASCVGNVTNVESSTSGDVGSYETHLYKNALAARTDAAADLRDAADLLNIEFTASCKEQSY